MATQQALVLIRNGFDHGVPDYTLGDLPVIANVSGLRLGGGGATPNHCGYRD